MNNQMPYFPNDNQGNGFLNGNNYFNIMFERLNNRLNRLEREIKIIENRLNRLENIKPTFLNNDNNQDDNMYIL